VWIVDTADAYAAADAGNVLHYDGTAWTSPMSLGAARFTAIGGSATNLFVLADDKSVWRYDGIWTSEIAPEFLFGVWGDGTGKAIAVGRIGFVESFDGVTWSTLVPAMTGNPRLNGVWGSASNDVFVAGTAVIQHYDGGSWSTPHMDGNMSFNAVWGSGSQDVFVVGTRVIGGSGGVVLHYTGATCSGVGGVWCPMQLPLEATTNGLVAVWGSGPTDVFAGGSAGTVIHYDGTTWTTMMTPGTQGVAGIGGSATGRVYAVGAGGTLWRYDPM
jgi:hypothetical protein